MMTRLPAGLALLLHLCLFFPAISAAEPERVEYRVKGLSQPAEILVDEWGVPHIYTDDHYDAFFVQGFNAARDRLWQIDLWRRRGLGELAEVLGPAFVEQDVAARLFLYRGDMFREWLAYGNDAKRISEAFVAGINAFVALTETRPELLPEEFRVLDYRPARWAPSDVVRIRSNGLWRNVTSEALRARIVCAHGLDVDARRFRLEPDWQTTVPDGLDPCDIPSDVTRLYQLAKAPVDFSQAIQFGNATAALNVPPVIALLDDRDLDAGSNNWAVAPERTSTGRPILANDPHRGHAVPSLRYAAHLVGPGINVIGAGEPALPGISIGHNERIAFGLTIFSIDQEDLMAYKRRGNRYRYGGGWEDFRVVKETFHVRGGDDVSRDLLFTRHGPVIWDDRKRAFAVQAAWLEPGMAPYFGSVEYMRANNWDEFLAALNRWGAPSENQVYADVDGNIGYKPAGLTPIRRNWDGLLPVPGDGRYEWQGFYDMDALPVEYNPARGWVATANAMSLPPDYPYKDVRPGFEWAAPWRIKRISEVLQSQGEHSLADSLALQRDYLSLPARSILGATNIKGLPEPAQSLFADWDFRLTRDSGAAALFEVWFSRHLGPAVMQAAMPGVDLAALGTLSNERVVGHFLDFDNETRQALAAQTIAGAVTEVGEHLGPDASTWRWGDLHTITFTHPLADLVDPETAARLAMPTVGRGGSGDTPNSTRYNDAYEVRSGASWRMVLDVGNWDHAYMTNTPGQSGVADSPFYDNLLQNWADDEALPLLYSREAIEARTQMVIQLAPVEQ